MLLQMRRSCCVLLVLSDVFAITLAPDSSFADFAACTHVRSCACPLFNKHAMSYHAARRMEYQAYEREVFESLASLVKDASSLRVYLAAAMRVEAETFTRATM